MAKKMTERERELSKENKRLAHENLKLRGEVSSLESKIIILREEVAKASSVRRQIRDITNEETIKEIVHILYKNDVI